MSLLSLLASSDDSGGGGFLSIGILLLIPLALYFFMIRPQRRRQREQASLQSSLEIGDEVVTTAGIFGFITGFDGDDRIWVEIDDDVQIRVARAAIQGKVDTSAAAEDEAAGDEGDTDADDVEDDEDDDTTTSETNEADRGAET